MSREFAPGTRRSDEIGEWSRRAFCAAVPASFMMAGASFGGQESEGGDEPFALRYGLASCMYGEMSLETICREARKLEMTRLDIWPRVHGNQREQLDEMGEEAFGELLDSYSVTLECITQYKLGPFGLQDEMRLAQRLGCGLLVTGGAGPKGLQGAELKQAVVGFVERMKPHLEVAGETGCRIAIENHGNNLIESADSLRWLCEASEGLPLGVALAPYHLEQDSEFLAGLIRDVGEKLDVFYAWQHGKGCMTKLPKEEELLQLPGRGALDFGPLVKALREIRFEGLTEVFMHPVPRGIPILPTAAEVSREVDAGRRYLESCLG